jgi:hypothetical protein
MRLKIATLAAVLLAFTVAATAQYPPGSYPPSTYPPGGQYPPSTYPPGGQYPPGQYPPNTYPDSYPTRLPGGVPVNLPVPNIKLPKKKGKDEPSATKQEQNKVTLASVDGTLRRLREKDLVLETSRKAMLRFRLIAKTRFEDKAGEPVRESLLHPGDQISVQVSPDDEETGVRVVLTRAATDAERAAADRPVDEASIRAPRAEDLGKARTVAATRSGGASEPAPQIEEDAKAEAKAEAKEAATAEPETLAPKTAPGNTDDAMIEGAREAATAYGSTLPNYLVQQLTIRYFSQSYPARWQLIDQVTADLAYVDGKEDYRNFRIDGRPVDRPEQSGSWSTGEFSTTLDDLLSLSTNAKFRRRGEQKVAGRDCIIFDYTVAQSNSHWTVVSPDDRRYNPAFEGAIWVDQATHRVLRLEQRATGLPPGWPFKGVEGVLEYGYVKIDQKTYLLPDRAENLACMTGSGACTRNVIEFRNYRKFTTESNVKFGQ